MIGSEAALKVRRQGLVQSKFSAPRDNDQGAGLMDGVGRGYLVLKETTQLGGGHLGHEWKMHRKVVAWSSSEEAVTSDGGG